MLRHTVLRTFMVVALCLVLAVPAFPQNYGNIGLIRKPRRTRPRRSSRKAC